MEQSDAGLHCLLRVQDLFVRIFRIIMVCEKVKPNAHFKIALKGHNLHTAERFVSIFPLELSHHFWMVFD